MSLRNKFYKNSIWHPLIFNHDFESQEREIVLVIISFSEIKRSFSSWKDTVAASEQWCLMVLMLYWALLLLRNTAKAKIHESFLRSA